MNKTERVKMRSFRADLSDLINRVRYHRSHVVLMKHGEPVAAVISMDDLKTLQGAYAKMEVERMSA